MWNRPWTLREGCTIALGLIIAGLMLQLSIGPVVWDAFRWPANILVLAVFLGLIAGAFLLYSKVYACRFLTTYMAALPALVLAVVLTLIMGLTRQTVDGSWLHNMLAFWPFVLVYVYIAFILGLITLRRLSQMLNGKSVNGKSVNGKSVNGKSVNGKSVNGKCLDLAFVLNHLGLFVALTTATLGNADMQRLKMICTVGEPEWRALSQRQEIVELPLAIELKQFVMQVYDDGSPRRFASHVQILTRTGKNITATVDVNKPVAVDGWKIYQYGYDQQAGAESRISIFELVSDPWLPAVYTGIYMMLAGALLLFLLGSRRRVEQPERINNPQMQKE